MDIKAETEKTGVGQPAPDIQLPDDTGMPIQLSDLWQQQPLLLLFLRHFGCPLCRAHVAAVRDDYARIQKAGGEVVLVTMGTPAEAASFRERFRLPFRCLADPQRLAYRAYGLPRGGLSAVAGPSIWRRGWQALWRHGAGQVTGDPYQLPGSLVINRGGMIQHARRATSSADWATTDELLAALSTAGKGQPVRKEDKVPERVWKE
jgi:peroxiredoxin